MISGYLAKHILTIAGNISSRHFRSTQASKSSAKVTESVLKELRNIVGKANVSTAEAVREQHGHDESYHSTSMPDVVVFAQSTEEVSKVAKLCNDKEIPLIPFGTGTGLEGGVTALHGGLCLDLSKMTNILHVHAEDFDCTVESGVTRNGLNSFIRDTGLWFPVDPGADASLCGMCSTSASGTNAVRYGTMRENVLNLQVVLADGRIIYTAGKNRRTKKTSAGYNLTNLFIGSEGTLGIITQATIRLYATPECILAAVVSFPTVQEAVDTTVNILQNAVPVARMEFLDEDAIDAFNKYSKFNMAVKPSLFLEFHGSPESVNHHVQIVEDIAKSNNGTNFIWAKDADERQKLWKARHELLYACTALFPGSKPYSTDVCVPISVLPEVVIRSKEMVKEAGLVGPLLGHVGDGNFHVFFPVDLTKPEQIKTIKDVSHRMCLFGMERDGTCTGEHGIGIGKRELLIKEIGQEGMAAMKQIKKALDPKNILNPGKVFAE